MGKIKNPILFSSDFKINPKQLSKLGLLNPILNGDTRLFVDPILLKASQNSIIKTFGVGQFAKHFGEILKLLKASKNRGDAAWRAAERKLSLNELPELCLGYGGNSTRGRKLAKNTRAKVLNTAKEIVDLGVDQPEMFGLIGLLEDGVGPDTIGDMTANAMLPALIKITSGAAKKLKIKTKVAYFGGVEARLPFNRLAKKPILLVPKDILRDLPVAADWSEISKAASENEEVRARVNDHIGNIWKYTLKKQKDQVRQAALMNKDAFKALLDAAYLLRNSSYDFDADPDGHTLFRETLESFASKHPLKISRPKTKDAGELHRIVNQIIDHFRQLVENNGVNYLLWNGNNPRKEKAAQRLFFAISDVYCKANNLDISPESDSGGGPVDFKFSSGYRGRLLVELKLSTGTVVHGYTTQVRVYEKAAQTFNSVFLVVDVGGMGDKLKTIMTLRNKASADKQRSPEIMVVDAKLKSSASKRKQE